MSVYRVFSYVVGRGCLLWPVHFLGKTLLVFALLHSVFQGQICLLLQVFLDFQEAEVEWFYEDLQYLLLLTPKKDFLFTIGDWHAKVGSQEIPGVTGKSGLGVQNEAGQRLTEFCQENTLVIANTLPPSSNNTEMTLHMDITRWSKPKSDWLYSLQPKMEKLYTVRKNKTGSWLWLRPWTPYCQIQT